MPIVGAVASLTALLVTGGAASASGGDAIHNAGLDGKAQPACLTAQPSPGTAITQERCTGDATQQWVFIGTTSDGNPVQIQNVGTLQCVDASAFGNGEPVVQVACGAQATGSYWERNTAVGIGVGIQGYFIKSHFANYCLDLENGLPNWGLSMQVWQCNFRTLNQVWDITLPFST